MATAHPSRRKVKHPYVTRKKDVCGGKAVITGTRIKVEQIAVEFERMGWSADQIIQAHPHLTLAQVHGALSYYYDNAKEINSDIRSGEQFVRKMRKAYPRSMLKQKLEARRGKATHLR